MPDPLVPDPLVRDPGMPDPDFRDRSVQPGDLSFTWALFNWPRVHDVLSTASERARAAFDARAAGVVVLDRVGATVQEAFAGSRRPVDEPRPAATADLVLRFDLVEGLRGELVVEEPALQEADRPAWLVQEYARSVGLEITCAYLKQVREIGRLETDDLTRDRRQAVESARLAALGDMSAGMAHEVNNPLSGIMGVAQIALGRSLADEDRKDFETILGEAARAARIVADFGTFVRARPATTKPVDLGRALEAVLDSLCYEFEETGIEVVARIDPDLPPVMVDEEQISQAVRNLVTNAVQAMPGGGRLTATATSGRESVLVSIQDTGPGIAADHISRVFDPFFTTRDIGQGPGLGLSFAFGVVHRHGGRIFAESESGRGARMVIEMPFVSRAIVGPGDGPDDRQGSPGGIAVGSTEWRSHE